MNSTRCATVFAILALAATSACSEKKEEEKDNQPALKSSAHHPSHAASGAAASGSGTPASASGMPASASGTPASATGTAPSAAGSTWEAGLPAKPVTAKAGDRVWALAPNAAGGTGIFDVVEVDSVQGNSATTLSLLKTDGKLAKDPSAKHAMTPGSIMIPAPALKDAKLKQGEIVIASIPGYHTTAAHVVKLKDDGAEVKYAHGDKVKDETVTYAMPLEKGIVPFAYVAAKKGASYEEILVAAVTGDSVYGVDESGNVVKAAKSDVKPLDIEWKDRKKGDKVTVLTDGAATETTIDVVSVTKWVYTVKINGAEKRVPFYAVVDKL